MLSFGNGEESKVVNNSSGIPFGKILRGEETEQGSEEKTGDWKRVRKEKEYTGECKELERSEGERCDR